MDDSLMVEQEVTRMGLMARMDKGIVGRKSKPWLLSRPFLTIGTLFTFSHQVQPPSDELYIGSATTNWYFACNLSSVVFSGTALMPDEVSHCYTHFD